MRILLIIFLYMAIASTANADITQLETLKVGDMRKLKFQKIGNSVPVSPFLDANGASISLTNFSDKFILINFWATWCAPCRKEMPQLSKLQLQMGGKDFEVLTIATGRNDPNQMALFFEEIGVQNLPLYRDPKQELARNMGVLGLPTSIIIDRNGYEIARLLGDADWYSDSAIEIIKYLILN